MRDPRTEGPDRRTGDRGSMAVEVVMLVPVLLLMMLLVVGFGRYVSAEGEAEALARDAVRAATLARSSTEALGAAQALADAATPSSMTCAPVRLGGTFARGEIVTVELDCTVSWSELGLIGLPGSADVHASSSAPLDTYRRTGG